MKTVHFYISNNNHHWQMMKPVMQQLQQYQVRVVLMSLCEFRRMETPETELKEMGISFVRLASLKFKGSSTSTGKKHIGGNKAFVRNLLRLLIWHIKVKSGIKEVNRTKPDLVVVPNDIAYPFDKICKWLTKNKIPFLLQQEGVRFPLPNEEGWIAYGSNGAQEILAWGEDSVNYFKTTNTKSKAIAAGNPRFDNLLQNFKREKFKVTGKYNILYVSNPVDDQGFCTHEEKIALYKAFLEGMKPLMHEHDVKIFVRLHPREDLDSFKNATDISLNDSIIWAYEYSLFAYLEVVDLTVILASTVGLESMMMNTPVAVIKLPNHGYVFNYVSSGCAIGIDVNTDFAEAIWNSITTDREMLRGKCKEYMRTQLSNRGTSASFIANHILKLLHVHPATES